jgi:hypothetical protein
MNLSPRHVSKRSPQEPMRFLNLPTELRLEIYKYLVEPITLTLEDPRLPKGMLKAYDTACDMSILRTCKTIYNEAWPTITDALRVQKDKPTYHFFIYTWPAVEQFIKINQIRFGLFDLIDDPSFKKLAVRGSRRSPNGRVRIDYAKHPLTTDLGFQQDIAFLEVAAKKVSSEINILHDGQLVPLPEYLTGISEGLLTDYLRHTRRTWKMVFEHGAWIWEESRITSFENDPLLTLIRHAGEPWKLIKTLGRFCSTEIGVVLTLLTSIGLDVFCIVQLYRSFPLQRPIFLPLLYAMLLCINVVMSTTLLHTISSLRTFLLDPQTLLSERST